MGDVWPQAFAASTPQSRDLRRTRGEHGAPMGLSADDDDLNAPLGRRSRERTSLLTCRGAAALWPFAALLCGLGAFAGQWAGRLPKSFPQTAISAPTPAEEEVIALKPRPGDLPAAHASRDSKPRDAAAQAPVPKPTLEARDIEERAGVKVIRAGGAGAPEVLVIDVAKALAERARNAGQFSEAPQSGLAGQLDAGQQSRPGRARAPKHPPPLGRPVSRLLSTGFGAG